MCLMLYAAGPLPLPTIPWDQEQPAFHAREAGKRDAVRKHFRFPNVYFLGSHQKCGCGFAPDGGAPASAQSRESARRLSDYLLAAQALGPVELFASWAGEEHRDHREPREVLTAAQAGNPEFWKPILLAASQNEVFAWSLSS